MKFRFEYEAFIKIYNLRFPEDLDMDEDYRFDISPVMIKKILKLVRLILR